MSELRWILIGFGIVLLAGIYLWGRRGPARSSEIEPAARARPEPSREPHAALLDSFDVDAPTDAASMAHRVVDEESAELPATARSSAVNPPARRSVVAPEPAEAAVPRPRTPLHDVPRARLEPTFDDALPTEELPVRPDATAAPTLSSSESPAARRTERRKILSLRLSVAPERIEGTKLLECLLAESLEHGKYDVFHRLHEGMSIFSVASMVEPGTFDRERMPETLYPGITLFAQLPGPVPGMHALNELVACARRLQQALGGSLQDERGVPLTVHRIERMRQEVREFERPPAAGGRGGSASQSTHP